jgi:hypothetical protein
MLVVGHGQVLGLGVLVAVGAGSGGLAASRGCRLCSLAVVVEGIVGGYGLAFSGKGPAVP